MAESTEGVHLLVDLEHVVVCNSAFAKVVMTMMVGGGNVGGRGLTQSPVFEVENVHDLSPGRSLVPPHQHSVGTCNPGVWIKDEAHAKGSTQVMPVEVRVLRVLDLVGSDLLGSRRVGILPLRVRVRVCVCCVCVRVCVLCVMCVCVYDSAGREGFPI